MKSAAQVKTVGQKEQELCRLLDEVGDRLVKKAKQKGSK